MGLVRVVLGCLRMEAHLMPCLIKGWTRKSGVDSDRDPQIYTETAQYLADLLDCVKEARGMGCVEIIIVETDEKGK